MDSRMMSRKAFLGLIETLEVAFRCQLNEKELNVYYAHLKSLPEEIMAKRVSELIITNKFFPRVSEIWNNYTIERSKAEILAKYGLDK